MREEIRSIAQYPMEKKIEQNIKDQPEKAEQAIRVIQNVMWRHAGVVRDGHELQEAMIMIAALRDRLPPPVSGVMRGNKHSAGCVVDCSIGNCTQRKSRAHFRTDFPAHDDETFASIPSSRREDYVRVGRDFRRNRSSDVTTKTRRLV